MVVQDVEVGLNISATLIFTIMDKIFMVVVEVDLGTIPAPLHPIIHVCLLYPWGFIAMVMI